MILADGLDWRQGSAADPAFLADAAGAALVIADPPWTHTQGFAAGRARDQYQVLPMREIVRCLGRLSGPLMALWLTGPIEAELDAAVAAAGVVGRWRWGRHVTTGAWFKSRAAEEDERSEEDDVRHHGQAGAYGSGYWWAGCAELVRLYAAAPPGRGLPHRASPLRNAHIEPRGGHSVKPVAWQRAMIRRWTCPGDLVVDPFGGTGTVAEAAWLEGRRSLSVEQDGRRWHEAADRLRAIVAPR